MYKGFINIRLHKLVNSYNDSVDVITHGFESFIHTIFTTKNREIYKKNGRFLPRITTESHDDALPNNV